MKVFALLRNRDLKSWEICAQIRIRRSPSATLSNTMLPEMKLVCPPSQEFFLQGAGGKIPSLCQDFDETNCKLHAPTKEAGLPSKQNIFFSQPRFIGTLYLHDVRMAGSKHITGKVLVFFCFVFLGGQRGLCGLA